MAESPDSTPGGEYADAVSQILDRDAEIRDRARRPTPQKKSSGGTAVVVGILSVVFVVVWVAALRDLNAPPERLTPQETELNTRIKTFAAAQRVREYEEEHGRPPSSLDEIGLGESGLTLIVEGDGWRVEEVLDGEVVDAEKDEDPMAVIREMVESGGGGMR